MTEPPLDRDEARRILREQCAEWLQAGSQLRYAVPFPGQEASPILVSRALIAVRANLDRLETFYLAAITLRTQTEAKARKAEQEAADAWDDQANRDRRAGRREFEGSQERYAYWRVATRDELRAARGAREFADFVKGTHDGIKLLYEGLDKLRADLNARLRHLQWENSMER